MGGLHWKPLCGLNNRRVSNDSCFLKGNNEQVFSQTKILKDFLSQNPLQCTVKTCPNYHMINYICSCMPPGTYHYHSCIITDICLDINSHFAHILFAFTFKFNNNQRRRRRAYCHPLSHNTCVP